ncbi:MAG TPA: hypothetical protein VFM38_03495 [Candidatus Limnocylindrales bacterium]|nr:hypothetical protein [Candidatus Limnocylindrales bacterium]
MPSRPTLLAILALPAAVVGYAVGVAVVSALPLPEGLKGALLLVVPLFLAGLCMVPFLLPLFDRMAKRDLETLRASRGEPGGPTDAADQDRAP